MKRLTKSALGGLLLSVLCLTAFSAWADDLDDKRAKVEQGPDFGFSPVEYAKRFNAAMKQMEQPVRITGKATLKEDAVQAVFNDTLTQNIVLVGTAKPESGTMNGFLMTAQGDGTSESGAQMMLAMAGAVAASSSDITLETGMGTVMQLVKEAGIGSKPESEQKSSTTLHDIRFSLQNSSLIGVMLSGTPVD